MDRKKTGIVQFAGRRLRNLIFTYKLLFISNYISILFSIELHAVFTIL